MSLTPTQRKHLEARLLEERTRVAAHGRARLSTRRRVGGEIMKLCGWRTRPMFDRYNIIDEADLAAAVAKRFGNVLGPSLNW